MKLNVINTSSGLSGGASEIGGAYSRLGEKYLFVSHLSTTRQFRVLYMGHKSIRRRFKRTTRQYKKTHIKRIYTD